MRKRILVVDDDADLVELLSFNLKKAGFAVGTVFDGVEALKKTRSLSPDLILLDLMLPELDGFAVCEILRRNAAPPPSRSSCSPRCRASLAGWRVWIVARMSMSPSHSVQSSLSQKWMRCSKTGTPNRLRERQRIAGRILFPNKAVVLEQSKPPPKKTAPFFTGGTLFAFFAIRLSRSIVVSPLPLCGHK
jgi:hypothetical protein